jgi:protein-L-isoaspartate O-methyltransferase
MEPQSAIGAMMRWPWPVGPQGGHQELLLLRKQDGRIQRTSLGAVRFVPMVRQ